jgi:hypothetical protein
VDRRGRWAGISVQAFGLVVLLASMAQAIASRNGNFNLIGVAVIACGYYVWRGSRLAAGWAVILMPLFALVMLAATASLGTGQDGSFSGFTIRPSDRPWAVAIGVTAIAWAVVNLILAAVFLNRPATPDETGPEVDG